MNKSLSGSDKDKYYLTKQRIKELLDTAVADIGTFEKWLGAQANSKDPLTGLIAARIKEESFKVHDENLEVTQNLLELYKAGGGPNNPEEYNKKYMRDASHTFHSSSKLFALSAIDLETTDDQLAQIADAKSLMMDTVGIVQHHDGITGTGRQHVADDYVSKVFKGISTTNPVYADIINVLARSAGIEGSEWTWC